MSELDKIIDSANYWLQTMRADEPEPSQVVDLVLRLALEMKRRLDPPEGCNCAAAWASNTSGTLTWICPAHGSMGGAKTAYC